MGKLELPNGGWGMSVEVLAGWGCTDDEWVGVSLTRTGCQSNHSVEVDCPFPWKINISVSNIIF